MRVSLADTVDPTTVQFPGDPVLPGNTGAEYLATPYTFGTSSIVSPLLLAGLVAAGFLFGGGHK